MQEIKKSKKIVVAHKGENEVSANNQIDFIKIISRTNKNAPQRATSNKQIFSEKKFDKCVTIVRSSKVK